MAIAPSGYVYRTPDGHDVEIAVIDIGRNIICVPTQTLSAGEKTLVNPTPNAIVSCAKLAYRHSVDEFSLDPPKRLLVSFTGCGEPMVSIRAVIDPIANLEDWAAVIGIDIRMPAAHLIQASSGSVRRYQGLTGNIFTPTNGTNDDLHSPEGLAALVGARNLSIKFLPLLTPPGQPVGRRPAINEGTSNRSKSLRCGTLFWILPSEHPRPQ